MTPEQIKAAAQRNTAKKAQERFRLAPVRAAAKGAADLLRERAAGAVTRVAEIKQMSELLHVPGFFPTPKALVARMMEIARIQPGMLCLEPSAGKGDIADAIADALGGCGRVVVCELNYKLCEILKRKGYYLNDTNDFTEVKPEPIYDRVIANPPFEHGQDRIHVMHMFKMLKPGGRLVSIIGNGCLSRSSHADRDFRRWLEDLGADIEENDPLAFSGAQSERHTGVMTSIVTIDKE